MPPKGSRYAERVEVTCPCGTVFSVTKKRYDDGRGRRCSKACQYAHMERPSGLKYNLVKVNPTKFVPGQEAWNKGKIMKTEITYKELHRWVARHKARTQVCSSCGKSGRTHFANISREYRRDLADWMELCPPCHGAYDSGEERGAATRKFGQKQVQNG